MSSFSAHDAAHQLIGARDAIEAKQWIDRTRSLVRRDAAPLRALVE